MQVWILQSSERFAWRSSSGLQLNLPPGPTFPSNSGSQTIAAQSETRQICLRFHLNVKGQAAGVRSAC